MTMGPFECNNCGATVTAHGNTDTCSRCMHGMTEPVPDEPAAVPCGQHSHRMGECPLSGCAHVCADPMSSHSAVPGFGHRCGCGACWVCI